MAQDDGFLSRWARRKAQASGGLPPAEPAPPQAEALVPPPAPLAEPLPAPGPGACAQPQPAAPAESPPTLADVAALTPQSDYSRFVAQGVDAGVKRAALKTLFSDPHFNVMDGLDVYIEDFGIPNPIPESMLRQMSQSKFLRLFEHEEEQPAEISPDGAASPQVPQSDVVAEAAAQATPDSAVPPNEDTDLRLQPDDAAGRPGPGQGPGAAGL